MAECAKVSNFFIVTSSRMKWQMKMMRQTGQEVAFIMFSSCSFSHVLVIFLNLPYPSHINNELNQSSVWDRVSLCGFRHVSSCWSNPYLLWTNTQGCREQCAIADWCTKVVITLFCVTAREVKGPGLRYQVQNWMWVPLQPWTWLHGFSVFSKI